MSSPLLAGHALHGMSGPFPTRNRSCITQPAHIRLSTRRRHDTHIPVRPRQPHTLFSAVNNTVKHAQASRLLVELDSDDDTINVAVRDNGRGMDQQPSAPVNRSALRTVVSTGTGLSAMRERGQLLNGHLMCAFSWFARRGGSADLSAGVRAELEGQLEVLGVEQTDDMLD